MTDALLVLSFLSAFVRFSDLGVIQSLGGTLTSSPASPITIPSTTTVGTVVTTFSVVGGAGTYTYSIVSDPLGYFTIVGNQLQVNTALSAGTDNLVIQATGSPGDILTLPLTVMITSGLRFWYF